MRRISIAVLCLAFVIPVGCGDDDDDGGSGGDKPRLTVSAATSLKKAFTEYGNEFDDATVRLAFAGSDELAAQIRQGVKPDVYAAANTKLPDQLYKEGLVEKPEIFTGNRLVLAVPSDSDIDSIDDLAGDDVKIASGDEDVPIGSYTREVLDKLPPEQAKAILDNVKSEEPDVAGIVGKLTQGAADAGFLYITDVEATNGRLKAIELDPEISPVVRYGAAVVKDAEQPDEAEEFIDGLIDGEGAATLRAAGFEKP